MLLRIPHFRNRRKVVAGQYGMLRVVCFCFLCLYGRIISESCNRAEKYDLILPVFKRLLRDLPGTFLKRDIAGICGGSQSSPGHHLISKPLLSRKKRDVPGYRMICWELSYHEIIIRVSGVQVPLPLPIFSMMYSN